MRATSAIVVARAGVPIDVNAPVVDDEILDGRLEVVGGHVQDRRPDLLCRLAGGARHDHGAAAPTGSRPERGRGGVALMHAHVGDVDAELVGHDLGDGRLEALAVAGRRGGDLDAAAQPDPNGGRVGREPAGRDRRWFGEEAHAETDEAAVGVPRGLAGPEVAVPDQLCCLLERGGGRQLVEHEPGRHRVGKVALAEDVAAAHFERVDAEGVRHVVDHQLTSDRLDHPRAAVRPAAGGVGVDGLAGSGGDADPVRAGEDARRQQQGAAGEERHRFLRTRRRVVVEGRRLHSPSR